MQKGHHKYHSVYAFEYPLTPQQKIAEILLERLAKKQNLELPLSFWKFDVWRKEFTKQVSMAKSLLKNYSFEEITKAIEKNLWCYSLGSPQIKVAIEKERLVSLKIKCQPKPTEPTETNEQKAFVKKNIKSKLSKLREIDGT